MRIAVTGSTGALGSQVVELLARHPTGPKVLALARRPDDVPTVLDQGARDSGAVLPVHADYEDPASLRSALDDVDVLVLVSSDGAAARVMLHHQNIVHAAVTNGVAHVVYLSGVDADLTSPFCYAFTNGYTERLLEESGCGFSFARASLFTEFFAAFLRPALDSGELRVPAGGGRVALVSRADVGRCLAALALLPPSGRHHDLTGPAALTFDGVAQALARMRGAHVSYLDIPAEVQVEELSRVGTDPWWTYAYSSMFASVREDRWSIVTDEVRRLTGRAPLPLQAVVRPTTA